MQKFVTFFFLLILCKCEQYTSSQKREIIQQILEISQVNTTLAGDILCNETINDDSIHKIMSLYNDDIKLQRQGICDTLDLDSKECYQECIYYKSPLSMIPGLLSNNSNNIPVLRILNYYLMSGSPLNFYYSAGNPDLCEYNYGTYCYVPAKLYGFYTIAQRGCCVPGTCKGKDAIKVLNTDILCYQSFKLIYKDAAQPVCEIPERKYSFGFWMVVLVFIAFFIIVISTTMYKQQQIEGNQEMESGSFVKTFNIQDTYEHFIKLRSDTSMNFLDGIRVWSMFWVIYGHATFNFVKGGSIANIQTLLPQDMPYPLAQFRPYYDYITNSFYFTTTTGALFSVDSFFWLSGLLGAFSIIRYACVCLFYVYIYLSYI